MEFWNSIMTEKSWNILQDLTKKPFKFALIGGWAVYLWTNLHKSKDIDIIIDINNLAYLKENYNLIKNDNLKKYEIKFQEIDLDIYTSYFSKLSMPVEDIIKYTTKIQNMEVVIPEILLILKQAAEMSRRYSVKGGKDRIDIMTLMLFADIDFNKYNSFLKKYDLSNYYDRLKEIINTFKDIGYLNLNPREFKLKKAEILKKLKFVQ
ncbi:MAG: hypothetical protein KJ623_03340 [Nanoarchaeota archaeon]|nr:hypothetical protein [Nanoarchaeota archaeon]MBU0963261.1 hypothetical protein [Nanoarchaeota archaeon]